MRNGDPAPPGRGPEKAVLAAPDRVHPAVDAATRVVETVVCPFHCLYQDALDFHSQSHLRLARSEAEASRLARASLLLYLEAADALIHQAASDLARPDLASILTDPDRPVPPSTAWKLLAAILGEKPAPGSEFEAAPWPQFAELLALRASWAYPGSASRRRAFYRSSRCGASFEPLEPHQVPGDLAIPPDALIFPRTGLPRDPYSLRPKHLDTARGVLDQAIAALDRRLGGALLRDGRHRREPVRVVYPAPPGG